MRALLLRFLRDESGRGVAEALLVTGTSLVIIPTIGEVGVKLAEVFAPAGQGAALAHSNPQLAAQLVQRPGPA